MPGDVDLHPDRQCGRNRGVFGRSRASEKGLSGIHNRHARLPAGRADRLRSTRLLARHKLAAGFSAATNGVGSRPQSYRYRHVPTSSCSVRFSLPRSAADADAGLYGLGLARRFRACAPARRLRHRAEHLPRLSLRGELCLSVLVRDRARLRGRDPMEDRSRWSQKGPVAAAGSSV
jgi:hypothetical protein